MATSSLLHLDGSDASTTITDAIPANTWTCSGNAQLDTAQFKFGTASALFDGTGDYITGPSGLHPLTLAAWTIEAQMRASSFAALRCVWGGATSASCHIYTTTASKLAVYLSSNGSTYDIANGTAGATTLSADTWYHIALVFSGTTYKLYLNGTEETSTTSSTKVYSTSQVLRIGADNAGTSGFVGWIDEFRFSNTAVYTGTFTAPTAAFSLGNPAQMLAMFV